MVCFVCFDNNVLVFPQCVFFVQNKGFVREQTIENRKQSTDGDNSVATGVLNFTYTDNGIIIFQYLNQ